MAKTPDRTQDLRAPQNGDVRPFKVASDLTLHDLSQALAAGARDFRRAPQYGLFFASIFVAAGLAISAILTTREMLEWLIPATAGFPILAPFTAVGLYEVSRRRAAGEALTWGAILGAVKGRGDDQILSMGVIIFVAFGFWVIVAHAIFSIAIVESRSGSEGLDFLLSQAGLIMLAAGTVVGAVIAFAFYAITVVSLPMLVDHEVDFLTAIITSLRAMKANRGVLTAWAAFIAAALFVATIPAFLGLFVVLPMLGHATWHLYRRVVR
ncbi:MAG: DUF2189 domain-containing protein [Pseudomonadota bacterium]